jgi:hypothetical protein
MQYQISNRMSGADLGTWEAGSAREAMDQLAQDAGYADAIAVSAATAEGELCDYETGNRLRPATAAEYEASLRAAELDCGRGAIEVDGQTCYVDGPEVGHDLMVRPVDDD